MPYLFFYSAEGNGVTAVLLGWITMIPKKRWTERRGKGKVYSPVLDPKKKGRTTGDLTISC